MGDGASRSVLLGPGLQPEPAEALGNEVQVSRRQRADARPVRPRVIHKAQAVRPAPPPPARRGRPAIVGPSGVRYAPSGLDNGRQRRRPVGVHTRRPRARPGGGQDNGSPADWRRACACSPGPARGSARAPGARASADVAVRLSGVRLEVVVLEVAEVEAVVVVVEVVQVVVQVEVVVVQLEVVVTEFEVVVVVVEVFHGGNG